MKNILKLLLTVIFVLFYNSAYAGYIGTLKNDIEKIITPVSGKITSAGNKYIVIDKGSADNIRQGTVISVFRNYGTYEHNGKIIHLKKIVCYAVVEKVSNDRSEAKPIYGVDEKERRILYIIPDGWKYKNLKVQKGDLFTLNSGRQKVAVLTKNPALYNKLKNGLKNVDFVDKDWLDTNRVDLKIYGTDWKRLPDLAFKLGIDYFLIPKLVQKQNKAALNLTVVAGMSGKRIGNISVSLNNIQYAALKKKMKKSEILINPNNITVSSLDLQYRQTLIDKLLGKAGISLHHGNYQMAITGLNPIAILKDTSVATDLAIGGINGDGNYRIIVASDGSAMIYSYQNGDMQKLQELSPINVVTVDLFKKLLIISGFNRYGRIKSVIYKYRDRANKFVKLSETGSWMRFVRWNGKVVVASQSGSIDRLFASKLYLYAIKKNKLVKFADVSYILKKTSFFNWDSFMRGDKRFLIYLSVNGNIVIKNDGKIIRKTNTVFGFGKNRIVRYPNSQTSENPQGGTVLMSRPIKFFFSKNGLKIIAARNYRTAVVNSLFSNISNGSALIVYNFDKYGLHREYTSGNIYGRLSAISGMNDLLLIGRAVPSDFMKRLWQGEKEEGATTLNRMETQ